ncbi:MAG: hypothetical protein WCT05_07875 [Lentisphaeria bacterium]
MLKELQITEMSWILGGKSGAGAALLESEQCLCWQPEDNETLRSFSARPYLNSLKGYLDPAGHFVMAACSLLKKANHLLAGNNDPTAGIGIAALSYFGAANSASAFFGQLLQKGPRLASPLIFPHSYASTAANLAAIEFGWGGPHMIFYGKQDCRESLEFAAARLAEDSAQRMLVIAYEAISPELLPNKRFVRNGALALLVEKACDCPARLRFELARLRALPVSFSGAGSVQDSLHLLVGLQHR